MIKNIKKNIDVNKRKELELINLLANKENIPKEDSEKIKQTESRNEIENLLKNIRPENLKEI